MDQEQLAEVVKEIEEQQALGRVSGVQLFKNMMNQPELVSISSANAIPVGPAYAYSQFTANFPSGRPILEAETLQLLTANIPLCTPSIPDTACTFWYYRLDPYANPTPNTENLYFVRLLPSYYKPEFITSNKYGQNVTFNNYNDLATQLALSCKNDLALDNATASAAEWAGDSAYQSQFIPSDITLTYNSTQNKFQMTGLNSAVPLFSYTAADTYAAGTTYAAGVFVTYDGVAYRSLQAGNVGNTPTALNSVWWAFVTSRLVQDFVAYTPYKTGQYMVSGGTIYIATTNVWAATASIGTSWVVPTTPYVDRYLVTGYSDPNVLINQNDAYRQWNQYSLFESGEIVQYQGVTYQSSKQTRGFLPFPIPNSTTNAYSATVSYKIGDYVYFDNRYYVNIKASKGTAPAGGYVNNANWRFIEYSPNTNTVFWKVGDLMTYIGTQANGVFFYKCIRDNNAVQTSPIDTGGVFSTNPYWIPSYWTPLTTTLLPIVGLNLISKTFDMIDVFAGNSFVQYPFVRNVPGQPFNPAPRRLLNSILGFSWNGIFNPVAVSDVLQTNPDNPLFVGNAGGTIDLLNRLRPVPPYVIYGTSVATGLEVSTPTTAIIFTADGYCNLVYTSVVYIYATVVGGSTLTTDPSFSTNLIGLASMNAGNLGVSFFANFIDTKLRIRNTDIYNIGIELRDEMNEPYSVGNNGICTFTLKLTYKDTPQEK